MCASQETLSAREWRRGGGYLLEKRSKLIGGAEGIFLWYEVRVPVSRASVQRREAREALCRYVIHRDGVAVWGRVV